MNKAIKLGHKVRDITTGIEGLAITETRFLTGNVQFSVQQPAKEGAYVDPLAFDIGQLEYVGDGIVGKVTPAPADTGIALGEKVQDIVTKFSGVVTRQATFMNGCVYFLVLSEVNSKGETKEDFVEYKRLKVVGKGVVAAITKAIDAEAPNKTKRPPGGPVSRPMVRG